MKIHRPITCSCFVVAIIGGYAVADQVQSDIVPLATRTPMDFVYLRERPLFSPERAAPRIEISFPALVSPAPVEPQAQVASQDVELPSWRMVGLVRSDRGAFAIFRTTDTDESFVLSEGDLRDGWVLSEVGHFDVLLKNGDKETRMTFPTSAEIPGSSGGAGFLQDLPESMPGAGKLTDPSESMIPQTSVISGAPSLSSTAPAELNDETLSPAKAQ